MVNITGLALLCTSNKLVEMVEWQVKVIIVICQSESSWSKHLKKLEYMLILKIWNMLEKAGNW